MLDQQCAKLYNTYKGNLEYIPALIDVALSVRRIRPSFLYIDITTSRKIKTKKNGDAWNTIGNNNHFMSKLFNTYKGNLEYKPALIDVTLSVRRIRPSFLYTDIATSRKMKTKKNGVA